MAHDLFVPPHNPGRGVAGGGRLYSCRSWPTSRAPIRVGVTIRPPVKTHEVLPVYPRLAQTARVEGIVILEATIDEDGRVNNVLVLRSVALLDDAALVAVASGDSSRRC